MQLFSELMAHGYKIEFKVEEAGSALEKVRGLPTRLIVCLGTPDGRKFKTRARLYQALDLESILAKLCEKNLPNDPHYLVWKEQHGHIPTQLTPNILLDEVGYPIHTSLRKNIDTHNSAITWNAIKNLSTEDLGSIWEACKCSLQALYQDEQHPTRVEAAEAFSEAVKKAISGCSYRSDVWESARTETERLAVRMLAISAAMTTLEEWMWGWLGFVIEPLPLDVKRALPVKKGGPKVGSAIVKRTAEL